MKTPKVKEIKKLENGKIAVRWVGGKKFKVIENDTIARYLIYLVTGGEA